MKTFCLLCAFQLFWGFHKVKGFSIFFLERGGGGGGGEEERALIPSAIIILLFFFTSEVTDRIYRLVY